MTRCLGLRVEYDGGAFHGFQRQTGRSTSTVQGLLEGILSEVLDEAVTAVCAGRTDTGVHAIGQVVSVATHSQRPLDVVVRALTRQAHGRMGVRAAWEAPPWFHARHNASRRVYQYHLLLHASPLPVVAARTHHFARPLDMEILRREAACLKGRRDFRAFQSGGVGEVRHFYRTVHRVVVGPAAQHPAAGLASVCGNPLVAPSACDPAPARSYLVAAALDLPLVVLEIEADAFLPRMVRLIVGTLLEVASGKRPEGSTARILRSRDSGEAAPPAPAHGLCLVRVAYPAICGVPL